MVAPRFVENRFVAPRIEPRADDVSPRAFHRSFPDYERTPLVALDEVAEELGAGRVWAKDETRRLGLGSFKVLGASWGVARALAPGGAPTTLADLEGAVRTSRPVLVAATEGNHGQAVAYMARRLGLRARIHVSSGIPGGRRIAIAREGAEIVEVAGTYDDALRSALADRDGTLLVSDAAWEGYETVPRWITDGYATLFAEIDEELPHDEIDLVLVQMGVGTLADAAVRHYRGVARPEVAVIGVEPLDAACVLASLEAGTPTRVPGPHRSRMVGLNCGLPSSLAWPALRAGLSASVAVSDDRLGWALSSLRAVGIDAGPAGAAGLVGLDAIGERARRSNVLVIVTEGDPVARNTRPPPR